MINESTMTSSALSIAGDLLSHFVSLDVGLVKCSPLSRSSQLLIVLRVGSESELKSLKTRVLKLKKPKV